MYIFEHIFCWLNPQYKHNIVYCRLFYTFEIFWSDDTFNYHFILVYDWEMLANPSPREAEMSINELSEYIWAKHIVLVIFFNRFITTLKDMPVMFIAPWSSRKWFELQQCTPSKHWM